MKAPKTGTRDELKPPKPSTPEERAKHRYGLTLAIAKDILDGKKKDIPRELEIHAALHAMICALEEIPKMSPNKPKPSTP